jgi:hypothetical protein
MKWEYRVKPLDPGDPLDWEDKLNYLGEDGWELVSVIPPIEKDWWPQVIFKRPKNSN